MDDLWEDTYICPINVMNRTTESAIYVMELAGYGMSAYRIKTQSAFSKQINYNFCKSILIEWSRIVSVIMVEWWY